MEIRRVQARIGISNGGQVGTAFGRTGVRAHGELSKRIDWIYWQAMAAEMPRAHTPDYVSYNPTPLDRQRASSFSELTPRGLPRPLLPIGHSATDLPSSGLRTFFGSNSSSLTLSNGASSAPLRKMSALTVSGGQPSARASPAVSRSNSVGMVPTPLKAGDSLLNLTARNVALAVEASSGGVDNGGGAGGRTTDDAWQTVCLRVLPLFNGEGQRGFVEDLNELVITHVNRTINRHYSSKSTPISSNAATLFTGLLTADLSELLSIGFLTLFSKLTPSPPSPPLDDEKFLARLNEVWSFTLSGLLPQLEAVFWVLRGDERLRAVGQQSGGIDIRRLALLNFRDQLILPQIDRIEHLFRELYTYESRPSSRQPSPLPSHNNSHSQSEPNLTAAHFLSANPTPLAAPPLPPSATLLAANARRRQMVAILASLLTSDERQEEMDALLRCMRPQSSPPPPPPADSNVFASPDSRGLQSPLSESGLGSGDDRFFPSQPKGAAVAPGLFPAVPGSGGRPRAWTMDSLDEEGTASATSSNAEGLAPPRPDGDPSEGKSERRRKRGFLPRLRKSSKIVSTVMGAAGGAGAQKSVDKADISAPVAEGGYYDSGRESEASTGRGGD